MANEKHLEILKQGVQAWNKWRDVNFMVMPDLQQADLSGDDLIRANLSGANLIEADLREADLDSASLIEANLRGANLNGSNLRGANLIDADLRDADLGWADLRWASLEKADLSSATADYTVFASLDLSQTRGLETVQHYGPSTIGLDTFFMSQGKIPDAFLRGAGVPDDFITYAASLVGKPFEFYSCFISYSSKDEDLAKRLHADLQAAGVRCWFAPEDLKIGAKLRPAFDEAIRIHDKLLLLLSEHSVQSDWVEKEVETAFEKERKEKRLVLFPVRLDDAVMDVPGGWAADIRRTRNIGDFRQWKDHEAYKKSFERLLRDLKASNPPSPS